MNHGETGNEPGTAPWGELVESADTRPAVMNLFQRLKEALPQLEPLLQDCSDKWGYEDPVYRFYHQSYKVFTLQAQTLEICNRLQSLAPDMPLNKWFMAIVNDGTGKTFKSEDNGNWFAFTRPIVEAFFHARFFLEMAVKYGTSLQFPPRMLPSGWAAFLYLYDLR